MTWNDFTSPRNIMNIQKLLQQAVTIRLGVGIPPQKEADLKNIMRAVYVQNPSRSLQEMNTAVLEQAFQVVKPGIMMNLYYQRNSGTISAPMAHPVNVSTRGEKISEVPIGFSR